MMKLKKVVVMVLLFMLCLVPQATMHTIYADDAEVAPFWLYTGYVSPTLQFYAGDARIRVDVAAVYDVYRIDLNVYLDQELMSGLWVNLTSWPASSNSYELTWFGTYAVSSGYRYRVRVEGTVYSARGSEPVSAQVINSY